MTFADTWQSADPDAVGGQPDKPPAPGEYLVTLIDGKAGTSKKGNAYTVLTFRDERSQHEWPVLFGFKSQAQANFAKNQIRELGVDVDAVADLDELDQALKAVVGSYYDVEVEAASDPQYDDSTYIRGRAGSAPPSDVEQTAEIPGTEPAAAGVDTDDVPFLWREPESRVHNYNPWGTIA